MQAALSDEGFAPSTVFLFQNRVRCKNMPPGLRREPDFRIQIIREENLPAFQNNSHSVSVVTWKTSSNRRPKASPFGRKGFCCETEMFYESLLIHRQNLKMRTTCEQMQMDISLSSPTRLHSPWLTSQKHLYTSTMNTIWNIRQLRAYSVPVPLCFCWWVLIWLTVSFSLTPSHSSQVIHLAKGDAACVTERRRRRKKKKRFLWRQKRGEGKARLSSNQKEVVEGGEGNEVTIRLTDSLCVLASISLTYCGFKWLRFDKNCLGVCMCITLCSQKCELTSVSHKRSERESPFLSVTHFFVWHSLCSTQATPKKRFPDERICTVFLSMRKWLHWQKHLTLERKKRTVSDETIEWQE